MPDLPIAWWVFWMVLSFVVYWALIWLFHRLAVRTEQETWNEHRQRADHSTPSADAPDTERPESP